MKTLFDCKIEKTWDYENGFYMTSHPSRIPKLLAHYDLYKTITNLPGHVVECGVYKAASLVRFATFRSILESNFSRKIIGFDAFGEFPREGEAADAEFIEKFELEGGPGISVGGLEKVLSYKNFSNVEAIKGNITETVPSYVEKHPELKIAILHIDVDVYKTSKVILKTLFDRVVAGGIIILDDYGTVDGETRAVDEYLEGLSYSIEKLPISHVPSFIRKE